ncbi:hypothetical protein BJL95_15815 [Methylomonas sp. LWB]|uniref:CHASE domain-containing protein n=1 Tax=Methylomonas sp. LWB TaxID=1905845 RepID=UPI0008D9EF74|nr:CHASE domain-containing protein [Methylomonas sp. LWB]OHX35685.1 hypothetical protein BJL95_15815 [Methylomonas sp. LWB]
MPTSPRALAATLFRRFVLTAAIAASGWLGLALAVPPGYASPIWPPAGIGLAALLIWGNRDWPAIWVAALLINLGHASETLGHFSPQVGYAAISVACGTTLQTLLAAQLSRHWLCPGVPALNRGGQILRYTLLAGPLSCWLAPSVGVASLWYFDLLTAQTAPASWWNWFVGDCFGAVILSPLMFCLFARPQPFWRGRLVTIGLPTLSLLAGLVVVFFQVQRVEEQRLRQQFEASAAAIGKALAEHLNQAVTASLSLHSLFRASSSVEASEFAVFADGVLARNPDILALAWAPRVSAANRAAFEAKLRLRAPAAAGIKDLQADGALTPAGTRDEYYPMLYVEPAAPNADLMGMDLGSEPKRRQTLARARASGDLSAATNVGLAQFGGQENGMLLVMPLFEPGENGEQAGYTYTVVRTGALVAAALRGLQTHGLNVVLNDPDGDEGASDLFGVAHRTISMPADIRQSLTLGDRRLEIVVQADADFISEQSSWLPWTVLMGGVLFAGLLNIYLLSSTGRAEFVEALVEARTAELDIANANLKKAFADLAEQEGKLRGLYELSPLGIALLDPAGNLREFNEAFRDITGYTSEELNRTALPMLLPADLTIGLADSKRFSPYEIGFLRPDGRERLLRLNGMRLASRDDAPALWTIVEDITEAHAGAEVLRQSELKYRELFNVSHEAVMVVTPAGFVDCNPATLALFGYDNAATFCGLHPAQVSPPFQPDGRHSYPAANQIMAQALTHGFQEFEWEHLRADGTAFPAQVTLSAISLDGQTALQAVVRDLSERKRVERALIAAKESAEAMAQSKSAFLANMSHEIRTPMNAILGMSLLALNKPVSDEIRDYLEKIHASADSLLGILNDILDFSKIEAGKLAIQPAPFSLPTLVETLRTLFAGSAAGKQLGFQVDLEADLPTMVIGDALRVQQVLANLLGNAVKFSYHGDIALRLRRAGTAGELIRFEVEDHGIGIAEQDLDKLFTPFSQIDNSITRDFGGTGLGLAISRQLLMLMGSDFDVRSRLGSGTVFGFELNLPIAETLPPPAVPEAGARHQTGLAAEMRARGAALRGARILVAEDNPVNQRVVSEFLQLAGIAVDLAGNGQQAVDLVRQHRYDAVLMDIHMPLVSGLEATARIRAESNQADVPIIALTAGVTRVEQERCAAAGMNAFIAKPVKPLELIERLCEELGRPSMVDVGVASVPAPHAPELVKLSAAGFDFGPVLTLLGGDESSVLEMLRAFKTHAETDIARIERTVERGDLAEAHRLLHALKGSAGNLGATALYQAAVTLDEGMSRGVLREADYRRFRLAGRETVTALARLDAERDG